MSKTIRNSVVVSVCVAAMMALLFGTAYAGHEAYTDSGDISIAHEDGVHDATDLGLVQGKEDGSYDPRGNVTREQIATIFVRAWGNFTDITDALDARITALEEADDTHCAEGQTEVTAILRTTTGDDPTVTPSADNHEHVEAQVCVVDETS